MRERRGCLYVIMFTMALAALFALMEAFRMLTTMQLERQEHRKEQERPTPWRYPLEKRP